MKAAWKSDERNSVCQVELGNGTCPPTPIYQTVEGTLQQWLDLTPNTIPSSVGAASSTCLFVLVTPCNDGILLTLR
jgi:hypothetical protein